MICLKRKKKKLICIRKSILWSLFYAFVVASIFMVADLAYAQLNGYFAFEYTRKELIQKLMLLVLVISLIPHPKLRLSILFTLVGFSFVQYLHFNYFGKNISAIEFYLFFTNVSETFETLESMVSLLLYPLLVTLLTAGLIYRMERWLGSRIFTYKYGVHIVVLGLLYFYAKVFYITNLKVGQLAHTHSKLIYPMTDRHSARNFYTSFNYFIAGVLPAKLFATESKFPLLSHPTPQTNPPKRTVILIIGESLRYDYFSLQDNKLTPKLQSLKADPHFFHKKVYSGGTVTKVSVSTLINRLKYPNGLEQITNEENCLFRLAKEQNITTAFVSAQKAHYLQMIRDMICPKYIDRLLARDDFADYIYPTGYDEDLKTLLSKVDLLDTQSFVVLQHRGSHSPYPKQYPPAYNRYTPYENTALYTDSSLFDLIGYIKEHMPPESFIFYVSDHGELLGEHGKNGHGHLEKNVYEVPFLLYTNSTDPTVKAHFEAIRNHFDIANYITYLLGYAVEFPSKEEREIFIMNSDLDGFSGYGSIVIEKGVERHIVLHQN